MKNLIILTLIPILIISCETTTPYDQETADVITQFYGDALGERESYNLLRDLSKDIGQRLSGSEGAAKAVLWSKEIMRGYGFDSVFTRGYGASLGEGAYEECFYYEGNKR